jgi:hypothetical protein
MTTTTGMIQRTCPGCGLPLCAWCATAWGQAAVHVGPDGKCANGHEEMWWRQ